MSRFFCGTIQLFICFVLNTSMLRTVIERSGFVQMYMSLQDGAGSNANTLATVPHAVPHAVADALFERPVQAEVVELLLLPRTNDRFTSCLLVHGMGGTGKVSRLAIFLFCGD